MHFMRQGIALHHQPGLTSAGVEPVLAMAAGGIRPQVHVVGERRPVGGCRARAPHLAERGEFLVAPRSAVGAGDEHLLARSVPIREGTLSLLVDEEADDGSSVLPFKRPLFAPAVLAGVPVLPAVVQLIEIDGKSVSGQNRDLLCWYGDMQFAPHLLALAGLQSVKVLLKILPEIPIKDSTRREELAQEAQKAVTSHYKPIT